jgi:Tfp pilus assembly protein PilZ
MRAPQDLLREYAHINRKRKNSGVSALEYQRWLDLRQQLERVFPDRPPLGTGGETRLRVEFSTLKKLADAVMWNVRPVGLFVHTPFAPEKGTHLVLVIAIEETGETHETPVVVVSNNVGPDFSTTALGMGLRFTSPDSGLSARLEEICGSRSPH